MYTPSQWTIKVTTWVGTKWVVTLGQTRFDDHGRGKYRQLESLYVDHDDVALAIDAVSKVLMHLAEMQPEMLPSEPDNTSEAGSQ